MARTPVRKQSRRQRWHAGAPLNAGHEFITAHGAALKGLRPITPRQYVQRGLDLANFDGADATAFLQLAERLLVGGEWEQGVCVLDWSGEEKRFAQAGTYYRDMLIRELAPMLDSPPRLRPRDPAAIGGVLDVAQRSSRQVLDVPPQFTRAQLQDKEKRSIAHANYTRCGHGNVAAIGVAFEEGGRTAFGWVIRPGTLYAAIDSVLWLLTAGDQPFAGELRQCEWEGCFNFFLAEKPKAGPRRRYCQKSCMEASHQQRTPERKAAAKAGLTVDEYRVSQAKKSRRK